MTWQSGITLDSRYYPNSKGFSHLKVSLKLLNFFVQLTATIVSIQHTSQLVSFMPQDTKGNYYCLFYLEVVQSVLDHMASKGYCGGQITLIQSQIFV